MIVRDFENTRNIETVEQLEEFMRRRYDVKGAQANSFWMRHERDYPAIGLLVRGDLAKADYLPEGGGGFASVGTVQALTKGEFSLFYFDGMMQDVVNDSIITFDDALQVAKEFLHSKCLPKAIKWVEL